MGWLYGVWSRDLERCTRTGGGTFPLYFVNVLGEEFKYRKEISCCPFEVFDGMGGSNGKSVVVTMLVSLS